MRRDDDRLAAVRRCGLGGGTRRLPARARARPWRSGRPGWFGQSLWWLGERNAGIDRRRDAYAAYQRRGDARNAGRIAVYLAGESRIDGREPGSGRVAGARPAPARRGGAVAELGWLAVEEAKRASDPAAAEQHARVALGFAHDLGDPDVECMALAQLGRAVVRQGRVEEGMTLLDEAMTVALGGETHDPLACGDACCTTLVVCDGLADLQRAAQARSSSPSAATSRRCSPAPWHLRRGPRPRGRLDARGGGPDRGAAAPVRSPPERWSRAAAGRARRTAAATGAQRGGGAVAGRARRPARRAGAAGGADLERGDLPVARALLDRRDPSGDDGVLLGLVATVALAGGDLDGAATATERLRTVAERLARDDLRAEAAALTGHLTAARGDTAVAARAFDQAVAGFAAIDFPLEEARARLALAAVLATEGSALALPTARTARDTFY